MERRERRKREKREKKEEKRLRERERERQTRVAGGSLSGAGFADDPVMYRATVFTIPVFVTLLPLLPRLGALPFEYLHYGAPSIGTSTCSNAYSYSYIAHRN